LIPKEIHFAVSKIYGFTVLYCRFECECSEVFREHRAR
jgi:hypothetical protein